MRVLIAGWFSFDDMGATAGDMIARDLVCQWLKEVNIHADVADSAKFPYAGGVKWRLANPHDYTDLLFVCGPFGNGWPVTELLTHFSNCRLIGVNLSLMESLDIWNPFSLLMERDSSRINNPDITLYAAPPVVPVAGIILSHKQKEYGNKALHETANAAIELLLKSMEAARVPIDTSLLDNSGGLRTPGEVESLIAKMDLVITTRLHGTALALKNGIPVIAIDPIAGGAKITSQVEALNWPILFNAESLDEDKLLEAFKYCLTRNARVKALECAAIAVKKIEKLKENFLSQLCLHDKKYAYGN
jgi:Polysaccharide pyruvyl transferase